MPEECLVVETFYREHGRPCCAGCDHWRYYNSVIGECVKSAPVSGKERIAMIGMESATLKVGAGHVMTLRAHVCGEFEDSN